MEEMRKYLIPDLIPRTSWFDNLRAMLSQDQWDTVRRSAYRESNYRCAICGGSGKEQGFDWPVECHERWEWDDEGGIQYLSGVQALCPMCHKVKHWGFATTKDADFAKTGIPWIARVNDWTEKIAEVAVQGCFQQWRERSRKEWIVDYSRAPRKIQEMVRGVVDGKQGIARVRVRDPEVGDAIARVRRDSSVRIREKRQQKSEASRPIRRLKLED